MSENLTPELTEEEIKYYEVRSEELCKSLPGVSKIHPIVMIQKDTLKRVVAYVKEPNFDTKVRVMDKSVTIGFYSAAKELMDSCLLREYSDALTYGEAYECDDYRMGVLEECMLLVKRVQNQYKKK